MTRPPRTIYIIHAFSGGPDGIEKNVDSVRLVARSIAEFGDIPVCPQLWLPQIFDEATERQKAMALCLQMLASCDVVQVHGRYLTAGMIEELAHAVKLGKPITQFGGVKLISVTK